jgi:hypothetical protein
MVTRREAYLSIPFSTYRVYYRIINSYDAFVERTGRVTPLTDIRWVNNLMGIFREKPCHSPSGEPL